MVLPDALRILDREGFRYDIIDSLFIDGAVPGSVIEQTPAGGSKVKDGRIIYLSINAYSPRMISCPKVSDMSLRQALSTLESVGLTDIKTQMYHRNTPISLSVYNTKAKTSNKEIKFLREVP